MIGEEGTPSDNLYVGLVNMRADLERTVHLPHADTPTLVAAGFVSGFLDKHIADLGTHTDMQSIIDQTGNTILEMKRRERGL